MSLELLDKTRNINHLLREQETDKIDFTQFCHVLSQAMHVNVLLVSRKGKILGIRERSSVPVIPELKDAAYGSYIDLPLRDRFMSILSTKENVNLLTLGFTSEGLDKYQVMIVPVSMSGERLGTLFIYRENLAFSIDDIILGEYCATVIGLAMQRSQSEEQTEEQHKEEDVIAALRTLTKLEVKAMLFVIDELDGASKGMFVASRLADKVGITRSVIVNALKKCESAGVISTKSFGVKGTSIQIINDHFTYRMIAKNMN